MPGISPNQPEPVDYETYYDMRESGVPAISLHQAEFYTARLMLPRPRAEYFANDVKSRITKIQHLGNFSIVNFNLILPGVVTGLEAGVNSNALLFRHEPLPEDPDNIEFRDECGYFVAALSGPALTLDTPEHDAIGQYQEDLERHAVGQTEN